MVTSSEHHGSDLFLSSWGHGEAVVVSYAKGIWKEKSSLGVKIPVANPSDLFAFSPLSPHDIRIEQTTVCPLTSTHAHMDTHMERLYIYLKIALKIKIT